MVRAGEDVTFIDMWPAHVDEMKQNGLRITHHEGEEPFTVKVRALHLVDTPPCCKIKNYAIIRPLKPLSFFVSQVTCEMRREGFGSAKPVSAIAQAGTVDPPGQPRAKGNPRRRFLSQSAPGTRLSSAMISPSG